MNCLYDEVFEHDSLNFNDINKQIEDIFIIFSNLFERKYV